MPDKPSIMFLNRVYAPARGATGRMARDLARAFVAAGWRVTVVTTGPKAARENDGEIRVIRVKGPDRVRSFTGYLLIWLKIFFKALFLQRHDLIVTMTDPPFLVVAGRYLSRIKRCRHIHWSQDVYPELFPVLGVRVNKPLMGLFRGMTRKAIKSCDKIVVIGRCMARHFTHAGFSPGRIAVIPNWPDEELMEGYSAARRAINKPKTVKNARPFEEQLRDGSEPKFRVLYSGNMGRAHPIRTIIKAAEILNRNHPEIEFVFVGDGPQFDRLAQERAKRELTNIRLMPYQPLGNLKDVMESGDVHLISMKHEAAGLLVPCKLYSALAAKRPCILVGPDDCETAKVIKDFSAGKVVAQDKSDELVKAILEYRDSSESWFAAHEGAAKAAQVFVPTEATKAFIERALDVVRSA